MEHEVFFPELIIAAVTVATFVVSTIGAVWAVKADTKVLKIQVSTQTETLQSVQREIEELRKVLITLADHAGRMNVIDERMMMQGRRIDDAAKQLSQLSVIVGSIGHSAR